MLVYKTQIIYHYIGHTTLKHKTCMHSPKKKKSTKTTNKKPPKTNLYINIICVYSVYVSIDYKCLKIKH